jgi:hypothetical protein
MLLSSPLVWLHYYVLLLPLSVYVIRPAREPAGAASSEESQISRGVALVLPFVLLLTFSFVIYEIVGQNPRVMCVLIILATLLTLGLAAYSIWRQRRAANRFRTEVTVAARV